MQKKIIFFINKFGRKNILFLIFFITISSILELIGIASIFPLIKIISDPNSLNDFILPSNLADYLNNLGTSELIFLLLFFYGLIFFIKVSYSIFLTWYNTSLVFEIQMRLVKELFQDYLLQPYIFHTNINSAELIRNCQNEVSNLCKNLFYPCVIILTEIIILIIIIIFLFYIDPFAIQFFLLFFALFGFSYYAIVSKKIKIWGKIRLTAEKFRLQHLLQGFAGIKEIKLLGKEKYFIEKFASAAYTSGNQFKKNSIVLQIPKHIVEFIFVFLIIVYLLINFKNDKDLITLLPTLAVYMAAGFKLLPSFLKIYQNFQTIKFTIPTLHKIYEEFNLPKSEKLSKNEIKGDLQFKENIKLENINFKYPGAENFILKNLNLLIKKGSCVGIMGGSGIGKSTLVDIFLGLIEPNEGNIKLDDKDIKINLPQWFSIVGHIPQEIFISDDSIKNNIAFGIDEKEISKDQLNLAIKNSQLENFRSILDNKIDSALGERGLQISGGERQRIGIARALYKKSKVLIFDEATNALDENTEKKILNLIMELKGNKTIIIVSHNMNIFSICDDVYELEQGKLKKIKKEN